MGPTTIAGVLLTLMAIPAYGASTDQQAQSMISALNYACDPSLKQPCGQNAKCVVKFPCQNGRCECASSKFLPEPVFGTQPAINCVSILAEGAQCTDYQWPYFPDGSKCEQVNATAKIIVCQQNVLSSKDGICKTAPPPYLTATFGEVCDQRKRVCDETLGLSCGSRNSSTGLGKCECVKNLVPQLDKTTCAALKYGDRCNNDLECSALRENSSVCSVSEKVCRCSSKFNLTTYAELNPEKTQYVKKFGCFIGNNTLKIGEECQIPTMTNTTVLCGSDLACIACPEDTIVYDPVKGKCRSFSAKTSTSSKRTTAFDVRSLIIGTLALVFYYQTR